MQPPTLTPRPVTAAELAKLQRSYRFSARLAAVAVILALVPLYLLATGQLHAVEPVTGLDARVVALVALAGFTSSAALAMRSTRRTLDRVRPVIDPNDPAVIGGPPESLPWQGR